MSSGLQKTFQLLTKTKNEAAVAVLVPALDAPQASINLAALRALLDRHSLAGHREIVRRLHAISEPWRLIIDEHHEGMGGALRDAVLNSNPQLCANGCRAILWFREFDLLPTLVNASEDEANPNRELVAKTLLQLADLLYERLAAPQENTRARDPRRTRESVLVSLENSMQRYYKHRINEVVVAFLLLVDRDNETLRRLLNDPMNPAYLAVIDVLKNSPRSGIVRLVLSFLDDPSPPSAALAVLAHRSDPRFVDHLLRKIGYEPSAEVAANLKRLDNISWLQSDPVVLERMDDAAQHATVQLAMRSSVSRRVVFKMLDYLIRHGTLAGRRAASKALEEFTGADANTLTLYALNDEDPTVQANVLPTLRRRGIPGALAKLIELLESPHELVSGTARECLAEFSFKRYLAAFDLLEEDVRRSTGSIVRRVDGDVRPQLEAELTSPSRVRRLRGVKVAAAIGMVEDVYPALIARLRDEDHMIRTEAAWALGDCESPEIVEALELALSDRSVTVQEAARRSLRKLAPLAETSEAPPALPWETSIAPTEEAM